MRRCVCSKQPEFCCRSLAEHTFAADATIQNTSGVDPKISTKTVDVQNVRVSMYQRKKSAVQNTAGHHFHTRSTYDYDISIHFEIYVLSSKVIYRPTHDTHFPAYTNKITAGVYLIDLLPE